MPSIENPQDGGQTAPAISQTTTDINNDQNSVSDRDVIATDSSQATTENREAAQFSSPAAVRVPEATVSDVTVPDGTELEEAEAQALHDATETGHGPRRRNVGQNPSRAREEKYAYLRFLELQRAKERADGVPRDGLSDDVKAQLKAQAELDVRAAPLSPMDVRMFDEWAPSSTVDDEPERDSDRPLVAAILRLPAVHWLMMRLACRTGERGTVPKRRRVAAAILHMGFGQGKQTIRATIKAFSEANAALGWTYDYPDDEDAEARLSEPAMYVAIHKAIDPENIDVSITRHVMVDLFKQLCEVPLRDEDGNVVLDSEGNPVPKHPNAGRAFIIDGSLTEGEAEQCVIHDEEHRQILIRRRADRDAIRQRYYESGRHVNGYKAVTIIDLDTGEPVAQELIPANENESDAVLWLLAELYTIWPECPAEFIIGDALFQHGLDFLKEVQFRYGLIPVFPSRADDPEYVNHEQGVPLCVCGPMKLKGWKDKFWNATNRRALNTQGEPDLPHGQWAPNAMQARLEFVCPNKLCPSKTTVAWEDPRVFTYLPRAGEGKQVSMRKVFLLQRNRVESYYAALQRMGHQGRGVNRAHWADDNEVLWNINLGAIYLMGKRLVSENGGYERALLEYRALGLNRGATRNRPNPGPTRDQLRLALRVRAQNGEVFAAPESWLRIHGEDDDELTGSAEQWAAEFFADDEDEAAAS